MLLILFTHKNKVFVEGIRGSGEYWYGICPVMEDERKGVLQDRRMNHVLDCGNICI